jgi:hypothetical protein
MSYTLELKIIKKRAGDDVAVYPMVTDVAEEDLASTLIQALDEGLAAIKSTEEKTSNGAESQ